MLVRIGGLSGERPASSSSQGSSCGIADRTRRTSLTITVRDHLVLEIRLHEGAFRIASRSGHRARGMQAARRRIDRYGTESEAVPVVLPVSITRETIVKLNISLK